MMDSNDQTHAQEFGLPVAGHTAWAPDPLVLGTLGMAAIVALLAVMIKFVPYLIGLGCAALAMKILLSMRRIEQLRGRMLAIRRELDQRRAMYDRAFASARQLSMRDQKLAEDRLRELQAYGLELLDEVHELLDQIDAAKIEVLADLGEASDLTIARRLTPFIEVENEIGQLVEQIEANFLG